jgi:hypothetical protein
LYEVFFFVSKIRPIFVINKTTMKKLYLLLFFLPLFAYAQPTITQSDGPTIGLIFVTGIDPTYSAAITAGGASQTWDYSTLLNQTSGGAYFEAAAGTPYASAFPSATLATHDTTNSQWAYFHGNSSGFYADGIDTGGTNLVLSTPLLIVPVPFTYNNTRTSSARVQVDGSYMGTPGRVIRNYTDDFTADGYGTLQVPGQTFTNTLRIKDKEVTVDSIFLLVGSFYIFLQANTTQSNYYRWVRHNRPDAFLLQIDADSAGTTATRSEYQIASTFITVPEIAGANQQVKSYPNPATNVIHIDFGLETGASGTINIYNIIGEVVRTSTFSNINQYVMYVNTLPAGVYHFAVNSSDNKTREGSFIVNH